MAQTVCGIGTLDLVVLKILAHGPNHGWGISNLSHRIRQMPKEGLTGWALTIAPSLFSPPNLLGASFPTCLWRRPTHARVYR